MYEKIINLSFWIVSALLFGFFLLYPVTTSGGDIVEYFGATESLITDKTVVLTQNTLNNLKNSLNPGYFVNLLTTDQNGGLLYYLTGRDGNLYPVHFIFYSLLAVPVRIILKILQLNELNVLRVTNLIIFSAAASFIIQNFIKSSFKKAIFLILFYLSPLVWFIIWPGPDTFYTSFLLIAVFLFFSKRYFPASFFAALASWHSQPLIVISIGFLIFYLIHSVEIKSSFLMKKIKLSYGFILRLGFIFLLIILPYLCNFILFGVLTPWTILSDGWTQINGFGLQNISFQKLYEQFFDLNMGLFWYSPFLVILGFYSIIKLIKNKEILAVLLIFIITAFFYQTNPAWHYGTSGFGPTRHILFMIPLLIYFFIRNIKLNIAGLIVIIVFIVSQFYVLSFNNFLTPNFMDSLNQSPYAKYILDNYPSFYNPTPEVFVDRTNHTDLKFPTSAIYKNNGKCTKAYVLKTDVDLLKQECGFLPKKYQDELLNNEFLTKASFSRKIKTIEATFWPDPGSCANNYYPTKERPFICIKTINEVIKFTGITGSNRLKKVEGSIGAWRLEKGLPVEITVPPGYIIQYYSLEGVYVDY